MEVVPLHDRGGNRHAGFGAQPTKCQIRSPQRALFAAFVRAVSIDSAEHVRALWRNYL